MFVFSLIDRVVLRSLMQKSIGTQNTPWSNVVTREGCVLPSASMRFPVDAEQLLPHVPGPCGRAGLMHSRVATSWMFISILALAALPATGARALVARLDAAPVT